jgi:hypothetical protein
LLVLGVGIARDAQNRFPGLLCRVPGAAREEKLHAKPGGFPISAKHTVKTRRGGPYEAGRFWINLYVVFRGALRKCR